MENKDNLNSESLNIQSLLSNYLHLRVSRNGLSSDGQHLDEDLLSAFVEGSLGEKEVQPIVSHLVDCTFCRHVTAELVKLDYAFADQTAPIAPLENKAPTSVAAVLSGILSRIFGSNDGVVFAHHEADEDEKDEPDDEPVEESGIDK